MWQIPIVHRPFIVPRRRRSSPKTVSCNANEFSDDHDLLPLMCHPLQSLYRLAVPKVRAVWRSRQAVSVHSHVFTLAYSRYSKVSTPHQRPRRPSFPPLSLLKRSSACLHYVEERNNGPSRTLVRGNSSAIDTLAGTFRVFRVDQHVRPRSFFLVNANYDMSRPEYLRDAYT